MISVVTVCYNSEKTIERTIESVLNQKGISNISIEHIFIDGKSKDRTIDIIEKYREDYRRKGIKLTVICEEDEGIYDAMNKGIHLSSGTIIGILNSDDWYDSETLAYIQMAFCENTDADIIMGAIYLHNGEQTIIKRARKSLIITSRHFNHPAMFVRRECYQDVGDYDNENIANDFDWYLRALKKEKKVVFAKKALAHFYIGGISTKKSFRNTIKKIGVRYRVYRKNGYSWLYFLECAFQELVKYCLIREQHKV